MDENKRWHASWLISLFATIVVGAILVWSTLDMTPSIIMVAAGLIVVVILLWLLTPSQVHKSIKIIITIVLVVIAIGAERWVYAHDRPILRPTIGGLISQNYNGEGFGLAVEVSIKNTGRQSGYADRWKLVLAIDGADSEGQQMFGQTLPPSAVNESQLFDEEFPPGKPARGWLFFAFPGMSHDSTMAYFSCNSELMDKVSIKLSLWDSKEKREFSDTKKLKDLGKESCSSTSPKEVASPPEIKETPKPVHKGTPSELKIKIEQHGKGGVANPGVITGGVAPVGNCNVVQTGGSNNIASPTCNPDPKAITRQYYCDGQALAKDPNGALVGSFSQEAAFLPDYISMSKLIQKSDFAGVLKVCAKAYADHPDWPTPLIFCAAGSLGQQQRTQAADYLKLYDANKHLLMKQMDHPTQCDKDEMLIKNMMESPRRQ